MNFVEKLYKLVDPWRGVSWFIPMAQWFCDIFLIYFRFVWNLKRFVAPLGSWLNFCFIEKRKEISKMEIGSATRELCWSDTCAKTLETIFFKKRSRYKEEKQKRKLSDNQYGAKKTSLYTQVDLFFYLGYTVYTLCNRMRFHSRYCHTLLTLASSEYTV
jgi:hypothetical protein